MKEGIYANINDISHIDDDDDDDENVERRRKKQFAW